MTRFFLSVGSNIDRYRHIAAALDALHKSFGEMIISAVYESEAVGFEGDNFLNLAVGFDSSMAVAEVSARLKQIERDNGRDHSAVRFSSRSLDIDILVAGDQIGDVDGVQLPREELLINAFVLRPMADIAAAEHHPLTGLSYAQHWEQYDKSRQRLWPVDFIWNSRKL